MNIKRVLNALLHGVIGAVVAFVIGVIVISYFTGIELVKPYVVQSGSMEPAIKTASVVFSIPQTVYNPGDVITFAQGGNYDNLITHRIDFKLYPDGIDNPPIFITSGDANEEFDRWELINKDVVGKVVFSIPYLGYAVDFAKRPLGFILLVIVPATIVIYEELKVVGREGFRFLKKIREEIRIKVFKPTKASGTEWPTARGEKEEIVLPRGRFAKTYIEINERTIKLTPKSGGVQTATILLPILGSALVLVSLTASFFFDTETSTDNILAAAESFDNNPENSQENSQLEVQSVNVVINEINWVGSTGDGLDEWVELLNTTSSAIDISGWVVENLGTGAGVNKDVVIPASSSIPPNGFFLISNHDKAGSRINVDPDFITTNVSLSNGGEQLILKTDLGSTIDTANGTGAWFEGDNSTPKKTMERKIPPGDGTQAANWQTATTHTNMDGSGPTDEFGSPGAINP